MKPTMKIDELVSIYVQLRDRRKQRKQDYEADDEKDKLYQEKIEGILLSKMNELGTESLRTEFGTAYKTVSMYTSVADWDALKDHIIKNTAWELLPHAVKKEAVKAYIAANDAPPPGVNVRQVAEVNIRRSAA